MNAFPNDLRQRILREAEERQDHDALKWKAEKRAVVYEHLVKAQVNDTVCTYKFEAGNYKSEVDICRELAQLGMEVEIHGRNQKETWIYNDWENVVRADVLSKEYGNVADPTVILVFCKIKLPISWVYLFTNQQCVAKGI